MSKTSDQKKYQVLLHNKVINGIEARAKRPSADNHVLNHILIRYFYLMEEEGKVVRKLFTKKELELIVCKTSGYGRIDPKFDDIQADIDMSDDIPEQTKTRILSKLNRLEPLQVAALFDICLTTRKKLLG